MDRRIVLGAIGAATLAGTGLTLSGRGGLVAPAMAQDALDIPEMVIGSDDAPIEFIEYASYTCPHCARFHQEVYPLLKADYIDQGKVRFIYREVYFDRMGLWASMLARCAGPTRFFGVTDMLYSELREWTNGDPAIVAENLRRMGRTVGLSDADLDSCFSDGEMAQALVERYEAFAAEHNVQGTPTFIINGESHSNMSYAAMQTILDGLLADAEG